MSVKVSVVIPVYNPGRYIDPCIDSLIRQTLPAEEFEAVFIDDGSTDDTPQRLAELARRHPNFRIVRIPNSGWPGKPRNIGVAEARGEYVQFLDQDDHLGPDALRRLYDMGHRNGSDIVLGKVASDFRGVPHGVFRRDREKCTLRTAPLFDSLTPHKMFRVAFLREHGIAYPEGKRRLEDQLYMMRAYFPAENVSIVGSYTCYYYSKRDDGKNAGSARVVPAGYYANLREVLDVVVANTEPGPFRDKVLRRFYRVEMLGRLSEPAVLKYDDAYLREMVDAVRPLAEDFMGDSVQDGMGPLLRLRAALLREDDAEGLVRLARFAATVKGAARLDDLSWDAGSDRLSLRFTARLVHGEEKRPLKLVRRDGRLCVHPDITAGFLPPGRLLDVTDDLDGFTAELSLRDREKAVEWPCPAETERRLEALDEGDAEGEETCELVVRGTARLAPAGGKGVAGGNGAVYGRLRRGFWDAWVPVRGFGLVRKARLGADRAEHIPDLPEPALLTSGARPVIPYFTHPHSNLTLDVDRRGKTLGPHLRDRTVLRMPGRTTELRLGIVTAPATGPVPVELVLSKPVEGAGEPDGPQPSVVHTWPGVLRPAQGRAQLTVERRVAGAPPGAWRLGVRLDGDRAAPLDLCAAEVAPGGLLRIDPALPVPDPASLRSITRQRRKAAVRRAAKAIAGPVVRRLPPRRRKKARRLAARLLG